MANISLGTVQFGLNYGVSNSTGQVLKKDVSEIFKFAYSNGINIIDTASFYGNSEKIIGEVIDKGDWKIITKTPKFNKKNIQKNELDFLHESFNSSLLKLGVEKIYGLLLHSSADLISPGGDKLLSEMEKLKSRGLVEKIGVSVYTGSQVDKILERFDIDIIQLPLSIFDQRLVSTGHIDKIKKRDIEVHARSIFLQELVLMDLHKIPSYFLPILPKIKLFEEISKKYSMSKLDLAIQFIKSIDGVDSAIVGVTDTNQLKEIVHSFSLNSSLNKLEFTKLAINNSNFVNPSKWKI